VEDEYWDYPELEEQEHLEEQPQGGALKRRRAKQLDYSAEPVLKTRKVLTKQRPYTISGLALALNTTRETLLDYQAKKTYSDTIKAAKARCEAYVEERLFDSNAAGVIFNLKNNYQWVDKQEVDGEQKIIVETRQGRGPKA
jgi:hypothetical protein